MTSQFRRICISQVIFCLCISTVTDGSDSTIIISDQSNRSSGIFTVPVLESPETLPNTVRFSVTLDGLTGGDRVQMLMNGRVFFGAIEPQGPNKEPHTGRF
ncbi:MAG TPA: hypothetical protein DIT88_14085, partial [Planctomycetaceae bacterium]|nr:hypothetical protein [Planctomycetaceae bacterium]